MRQRCARSLSVSVFEAGIHITQNHRSSAATFMETGAIMNSALNDPTHPGTPFETFAFSPEAATVMGPVENRIDQQSTPLASNVESPFALMEMLLKDQRGLNRLLRDPAAQRRAIPTFLMIGLGGYAVFAMTLALIFCSAGIWPHLMPLADWLNDARQPVMQFHHLDHAGQWQLWTHGSAAHLVMAYLAGLAGAIGICLPSFYFYSLLAGVRTSLLQVATSALNGLASGAVAVLGALPIYVAVMLGLVIFHFSTDWLYLAGFAGLALPFLTGLYGTRALYLGFTELADTMPQNRRNAREKFLRRLLLAWSACYSAITPVMIFTLWEFLGR